MRAIGGVLVAAGFVLNEWVVAALFSPDGHIHPTNALLIRVFDLGCILIGVLVFLLGRGRVRRGARSCGAAKVAAVCVFGVLLSPVLVEIGLRGYFGLMRRLAPQASKRCDGRGWCATPNLTCRRKTPAYGLVKYSTTRGGFRVFGEARTARVKVFVLGDSSTQAVQVSDGKTYYDALAKCHGTLELFAYGTGGYGSLQEYMVLDEWIDIIRPHLVLWQFDGT